MQIFCSRKALGALKATGQYRKFYPEIQNFTVK